SGAHRPRDGDALPTGRRGPRLMRKRSLGRALAMKYIFSLDLAEDWSLDGLAAFASEQERNLEAREFAQRIVEGVIDHKSGLIRAIEESARNWSWKRMPTVDRALLLVGSWEILHAPDIPTTVTINEIVDLAKLFSTKSSGSFVNGVLDTIAKSNEATP
ncbi:MAG: transcription antitermination factor NusB, partial [Planctomycetes bacterium]|nr:transcription antitermination factor NusB [Planctomycetota bacterium]